MMDACGGGSPRRTRIGQFAGLRWRTGLVVFSVFGMLAAITAPTVAQAARASHADRASHTDRASHAARASAAARTEAGNGHAAPSGSDASCPPARSAAAGSATL